MWNSLKSSLFTFLLLGTVGIACEGSNPLSSSNPTVLMESSFEVNGQQSLAPWTRMDSQQLAEVVFTNDVPPDGGQWALGIRPPKSFQQILTYTVPSSQLENLITFRLTYWAKVSSANYPDLWMEIETQSPTEIQDRAGGSSFYSTAWRADTMLIAAKQPVRKVTVSIRMWNFKDADSTAYVYFDRVKLEGW